MLIVPKEYVTYCFAHKVRRSRNFDRGEDSHSMVTEYFQTGLIYDFWDFECGYNGYLIFDMGVESQIGLSEHSQQNEAKRSICVCINLSAN